MKDNNIDTQSIESNTVETNGIANHALENNHTESHHAIHNTGAKAILVTGIVFAFLSVCLGAFAAHGLKGLLSEYQMGVFETAVRYQMYHALALILLSIFGFVTKTNIRKLGLVFTVGIVIFSGSLYALVLLDMPRLGAITPIGGVLLLAAWLWFLVIAVRTREY